MTPESLEALATLVLALTAANERLIEVIKNLFPKQLAKEKTTEGGVLDPIKDRSRQLRVQVLSLISALLVAAWVAAPPDGWFGWWLSIGTGPDARRIHVVPLALLTAAGSAFWNGIIDFTRAAAKLREEKTDLARKVTVALAANSATFDVAGKAAAAPPPGGVAVISVQL